MLSWIKSAWYAFRHPYETVELTVVRRYVDAQKNFIGELYASGKMIGASCDNFPFNADKAPLTGKPRVCYSLDFTAPLPENTIRVGAFDPQENDQVRAYMALRSTLPVRVTILNRFVEHVLEKDCVKDR